VEGLKWRVSCIQRDVQLQVRWPSGQWIQATAGAPAQVAVRLRFGVLPGKACEPGQVADYCQEQLVSERRWMIGGAGR
jgi:hypothetical protein